MAKLSNLIDRRLTSPGDLRVFDGQLGAVVVVSLLSLLPLLVDSAGGGG